MGVGPQAGGPGGAARARDGVDRLGRPACQDVPEHVALRGPRGAGPDNRARSEVGVAGVAQTCRCFAEGEQDHLFEPMVDFALAALRDGRYRELPAELKQTA